MRAACLYFKGDWAEYAHTVGLPGWNDSLRPCFACSAFGQDMYCTAGNSEEGLRWQTNSAQSYEEACQRCEIKVCIASTAQRDRLAACLRFDRRGVGPRGLALQQDFPQWGLRADDRLEPSAGLPDIGSFGQAGVPLEVVFWRREAESLSRHRNPRLLASPGLAPEFHSGHASRPEPRGDEYLVQGGNVGAAWVRCVWPGRGRL